MTPAGFDLIRAAYDAPGLDQHSGAVLVLLAFMANGDAQAWPSIDHIAEKVRTSRRTVQAALRRLEEAGLIAREERIGRGCIYTVTLATRAGGAPLPVQEVHPCTTRTRAGDAQTRAPRAPKQPRTTNPQKATPSSGEREPRGSRLDPDFEIPDEWITWAIDQRGWSLGDAHDEGARFRDYWIAQPGKAGRKSDWPATWRNWVRGSRRQPASRAGKSGRALQMLTERMKENGQWDS